MKNKLLGVISLGCSKNRLDTEGMLYALLQNGFEITEELDQADLLIVNTCSFIQSAKEESIEAILQAGEIKSQKEGCKLLVTGCLPERYREELARELPEVDAFVGVNQYGKIVDIVNRMFEGERIAEFVERAALPLGRVRTTPKHLAYVRIAEGCDHACAYCAIPSIRGPYRSRPMEEIIEECKHLIADGAKEIVLIAQDTSYYGKDLYGGFFLSKLLQKIDTLGAQWVRILYAYPERITDELLSTIVKSKSILPYLDLPLQHVNDEILRAMGRPTTQKKLHELLTKIHDTGKEFTLRTTFITGFPGETEEQFEELTDFVKQGYFAHVGAFAYSKEEGTRAAKMPNQIPKRTKEGRRGQLLLAQQPISKAYMEKAVGKIKQVIIEEYDEDICMYVGRAENQAPEVDGVTYISSPVPLILGQIVPCKIVQANEYDWMGEAINDVSQ